MEGQDPKGNKPERVYEYQEHMDKSTQQPNSSLTANVRSTSLFLLTQVLSLLSLLTPKAVEQDARLSSRPSQFLQHEHNESKGQ